MIDAHVHIWRLGHNDCSWPTSDLPAIYRDFDLADVDRTIAGTGVQRVILVQSQESERDTHWLLREAQASTIAAGVVGWLEPSRGDMAAQLARAGQVGPLVGLRAMAQDRSPAWLASSPLQEQCAAMANADLALDLLIRPQHLRESIALARRFPSLRILIDHCAKPAIAEAGLADWREAIAPIADLPNIMCKLSGLITEAAPGAPIESLAPYVEAALALFGPDRLIWGSDWPVINLNGAYGTWLDFARSLIPERDRDAVFDANARAFYGLAG